METTCPLWKTASRQRRPIAIVTTCSCGNGRSRVRALELDNALRSRGHRVIIREFSRLDDLRIWAATTSVEYSLLVCIGGDGTLNATAAAALRQSVPLLPVPSGFGNLFASALQLPRQVDQLIDVIDHGAVVRVDVGQYQDELFLCQQSFGLLQQIQDRTEAGSGRPRIRWLRAVAYYKMALRQLLRGTRLPCLTVTVDGWVVARDAAIVTVSNVPTYGAWLKLTPFALPTDGLFDVFVMRGRSKKEILSRLLQRHLRLASPDAGMFVRQGRRVFVAAPHRPSEALVLQPHRLRVLVGPQTVMALGRAQVSMGNASGSRKVA